jgi:UDP-N-acetylglucosamine acyltransferase
MTIHPTAVIESGAELDPTVRVGPYTVIGKGVMIGADTEIEAHSVISGPTRIGVGNRIGSFTNLGAAPQDLGYRDEETTLTIGDHNLIREYVSIHRGSVKGGGATVIGDHNMLMAYTHIAHDCKLGNHIIMANAATLGGHVTVEDRANLGGFVGVHQFTRIGKFSYIGGMSGLTKDVPPFAIVAGTRNRMRIFGINRIGLKRNGFPADDIKMLHGAFKILFMDESLLLQEAITKAKAAYPDCALVTELLDFIRSSERGIIRAYGEDE